MKKKSLISIRVQSILMCVPLLNCLVLFAWLYNYGHSVTNRTVFAKSLLVIFFSTIPLVILQILLSKIFANQAIILSVINSLMTYFIPFSMSFNLIRYQKKVLDFDVYRK